MTDEKPKRTRKTTADATTKPAARKKAPARKPVATPRSRRSARPTVTHAKVAERAYQLHLEGHGDAFANWVRAEEELAAA